MPAISAEISMCAEDLYVSGMAPTFVTFAVVWRKTGSLSECRQPMAMPSLSGNQHDDQPPRQCWRRSRLRVPWPRLSIRPFYDPASRLGHGARQQLRQGQARNRQQRLFRNCYPARKRPPASNCCCATCRIRVHRASLGTAGRQAPDAACCARTVRAW
jgi:hypothetical protein